MGSGSVPRGSIKRDPAAELGDALISALIEIPFMTALADRRLLLQLIRRSVDGFPDVRESDVVRMHVVQIVLTCLQQPEGLRGLEEALLIMAPDAPASKRAIKLIRGESPQSLVVETPVRRPSSDAGRNSHAVAAVNKTVTRTRGTGNAPPNSEGTVTPRSVPLPKVWGDVPQRNPSFTGRETLLREIHDKLSRTQQTAVLPQALLGMGGVGKTQLATEYVHRHSAEYDLIWWVAAGQEAHILASLTQLAQRLKLEVSRAADAAVPAVREALSTGATGYRNWLLVFDNAEAPRDVKKYFPTGGGGKILVTSRDPDWSRFTPFTEVDGFTRDESKAFLHGRKPDLSDHDAERLASALGDLPLAIEQAAAGVSAIGMSVGEYLTLLEEKRVDVLEGSPAADYPDSVAAAIELSIEKLKVLNPAALHLLQICCFVAPEPISRELFARRPAASITPEVDAMLKSSLLVNRAIVDIKRCALAKADHGNPLQIHPVVQTVVIGRMSGHEQQVMRDGADTLRARRTPVVGANEIRYDVSQVTVGITTATTLGKLGLERVLDNVVRIRFGGDHHPYLIGTVPSRDPSRPHVVAVAQQTSDGTRDAAWLAGHMRGTFPRLTALAMCDTGSGVPSRDVELGDIAVATDVVDYRHERAVDGSNTARKPLPRPGTVWVNADNGVAEAELGGHPAWLPMLEKLSRTPRFRRPAPGHPRAHRGSVGSADLLIGDAALRDRIAREHGILALEGQGAGIAVGSHLIDCPWFVVLGIADHADNAAVNDQWQAYASLAAACYLRAVLAECEPFTGAG
jgi:nucleoside phosphorylase